MPGQLPIKEAPKVTLEELPKTLEAEADKMLNFHRDRMQRNPMLMKHIRSKMGQSMTQSKGYTFKPFKKIKNDWKPIQKRSYHS